MENINPFSFINPSDRMELRNLLFQFDSLLPCVSQAIDRLTEAKVAGFGGDLRAAESVRKLQRILDRLREQQDTTSRQIDQFLIDRNLVDYIRHCIIKNDLIVIRDDPDTIYLD